TMTSLVVATFLILSTLTPPPQAPPRIRMGDLYRQAIQAGALKITFVEVNSGIINPGSIKIEVENPEPAPVSFSPTGLYFVRKDGVQASVRGIPNYIYIQHREEEIVCAPDLMIAPNARIREHYQLSERLQLPVRVYYHDKLMLEIID